MICSWVVFHKRDEGYQLVQQMLWEKNPFYCVGYFKYACGMFAYWLHFLLWMFWKQSSNPHLIVYFYGLCGLITIWLSSYVEFLNLS